MVLAGAFAASMSNAFADDSNLDGRVTGLETSVDNTNKKLNGMSYLMFGGDPVLDNEGKFAGFTNTPYGGSGIFITPDGKIQRNAYEAGLYGKGWLMVDKTNQAVFGGWPKYDANGNLLGYGPKNSDELYVDANGKAIAGKEQNSLIGRVELNTTDIDTLKDVKADKADLDTLGDRVTTVEGDINKVKNVGGKIVANKDVIINKADSVINEKVENLKLDIKKSIGDIVIEGNSEVVNNIKNEFHSEISKEIDNSITTAGKDFQDQIDNQKARGESAYIALDNRKADRNDLSSLEADLRDDGKAAYDDLSARLDKATSTEEINNILNQYKKDQLAKINAKVQSMRPAANDALQNAKEKAKNEANIYVKGKIDQAIADNTDSAKDYVTGKIDDAMKDAVAGGKELNDRVENLEKVVDTTKETVGKIASSVPKAKATINAKVNNARDYVNNINDKADEALSIGHDNTQAIATERQDRIEGQAKTLNESKNYTNEKFNALKKTINNNRKKASAGTAGVAAMANIPALSGNADYSVGMGIGHYDGQQSLSAGFTGRVNQNVVTKFSVSSTQTGDAVIGAGASFEF